MRVYQHCQSSKLYSILLILIGFIFLCLYIDSGHNPMYIVSFSIIIFVIFGFSKMCISIDDTYLKVKFGFGIYTRKFFLQDIVSVKRVRNKWYYGRGIKLVWVPEMTTIYSVYGLDAIEIIMKNGKRIRIGSDDVLGLEEIIKRNISQ